MAANEQYKVSGPGASRRVDMSPRALQQRWLSVEGRLLAQEVLKCLLGLVREFPEVVGTHDGRRDLRGLILPDPRSAGSLMVGDLTVKVMSGLHEFHGVQWKALDLSGSRLSALRFFGSGISDCRFDGASCRDWRLWDTEVRDSSFVGADFRDSALGTWHDGRTNGWRNVDFERADLRGVLARGCVMEGCSFDGAPMSGVEFQQARIRHCRFAAALQKVVFDGREIAGRPEPSVFVDVDFSDAMFQEVEFWGCRFSDVKLPEGVYVIPSFPRVARRVLELLDGDESVESRMLRAQLTQDLKLPGTVDSVEVFNRADYIASGGERFADLAESVLRRAAQATPR